LSHRNGIEASEKDRSLTDSIFMTIGIRRSLRACVDAVNRAILPHDSVQVAYEGIGASLKGFRGDHITRQLHSGRFYEHRLLDHIYQRYGEGGIYIDIGAFIGNHTVFFGKICKGDLVIAIEPNPRSFALLKYNVEQNHIQQEVHLHNVAVSDRNGHCSVREPIKLNVGSAMVVGKQGNTEMTTLDQIVTVAPKLLKIDTEGYGLEVLRGARRILTQHHPIVVVETFPEEPHLAAEYLASFGYRQKAEFNATPTFVFE